jgi:hypothetical protein
MPIPVANIIAIQEEVLYCGFSPSWPRVILPNRPAATTSTKMVKTVAAITNSQPKFCSTPARAASATVPRLSGLAKPQTMNATAIRPATPKTTLSVPTRCSVGPRPARSTRRAARWT